MKKQSEFFVIISPPKPVCQIVSELKAFVRDAIGHPFDSSSSRAHISLFRFEDPHTESGLYLFEDRVSTLPPFTVSIKNLAVSREERTIYLDIPFKSTIQDLTQRLTGREINPRITIAKNLSPEDFVRAWRDLKKISYSYDFVCDHITVLKKGSGRWKNYIKLALANSRCSTYN